jgi:hypothetical protein
MKADPTSQHSDPDCVAPFDAWCRRVGISESTGRRLLASGDGPRVTRLSARRIGIRERDHRVWLDSRGSTHNAA